MSQLTQRSSSELNVWDTDPMGINYFARHETADDRPAYRPPVTYTLDNDYTGENEFNWAPPPEKPSAKGQYNDDNEDENEFD